MNITPHITDIALNDRFTASCQCNQWSPSLGAWRQTIFTELGDEHFLITDVDTYADGRIKISTSYVNQRSHAQQAERIA